MIGSTAGIMAVAGELELTPREREQAHLYLKQTKTGITGAIRGISGTQWTYVPAAEQWSVSQIVEHVIWVLERVAGPVRDLLAQAPPPPADRDAKLIDGIVIHQFPNRLAKFQAPEFALPSGRFASPSEALDSIERAYASLAEYLESTPDLREHAIEALPLKAVTNGAHSLLDGYQFILAGAAHTERHTKQILEVRASENFPSWA